MIDYETRLFQSRNFFPVSLPAYACLRSILSVCLHSNLYLRPKLATSFMFMSVHRHVALIISVVKASRKKTEVNRIKTRCPSKWEMWACTNVPCRCHVINWHRPGGRHDDKSIELFLSFFIDLFSHLYKRVCPSVRSSVRPAVTLEFKSC